MGALLEQGPGSGGDHPVPARSAPPQAPRPLRRSARGSFPHSGQRPTALPSAAAPLCPQPTWPLPSSNRAAPVGFPLRPPPARPAAASARSTRRWRKRLRAFEFQGSRQSRAQRRREPRQPRGPSMDSLPGEDPTLPLAFEGRYGGAAGGGALCVWRARPRMGSGGRARGRCALSPLLLLPQRPAAPGHLPRGPPARPARPTR